MILLDLSKRPKLRHWFSQSAVRRGSKALVVFHTTFKSFTSVDPQKSGGLSFFSDKPRRAAFGPNVFPAILRILNPFMLSREDVDEILSFISEKDADKVLKTAFIERDSLLSASEQLQELLVDNNTPLWQSKIIVNAIKRAGFDGVITKDTFGGSNEYVVFHRNQVFSAAKLLEAIKESALTSAIPKCYPINVECPALLNDKKESTLEELVLVGDSNVSGPFESTVNQILSEGYGVAKYKGRKYRLLFYGNTKYGKRAKLQFWDGSKEFWVDAGKVTVLEKPGRNPREYAHRARGLRGRCRDCGGEIVDAPHHRAMAGLCGECAFDEFDM